MDNIEKEIKRFCKILGVEKISHRRPLSPETILQDLKQLASSLGKLNKLL